MIKTKKLNREVDLLGREAANFGVKYFHHHTDKIKSNLFKIQTEHCKKITRKYGLAFAVQVYKTAYVIMTNINLQRQKQKNPPVVFFTDGMDNYFNNMNITPYD